MWLATNSVSKCCYQVYLKQVPRPQVVEFSFAYEINLHYINKVDIKESCIYYKPFRAGAGKRRNYAGPCRLF